jgi:hypothetical protein
MMLTPIPLNNVENGNQLALNNSLYLPIQFAKNFTTDVIHVKINNKIIKTMFSNKIPDKQIGVSKNLR